MAGIVQSEGTGSQGALHVRNWTREERALMKPWTGAAGMEREGCSGLPCSVRVAFPAWEMTGEYCVKGNVFGVVWAYQRDGEGRDGGRGIRRQALESMLWREGQQSVYPCHGM